MFFRFLSLAAALTLAGTGSAFAMSSMGMGTMDKTFVMKAAQGGTFEVQISKLALEKSSNAGVKQFSSKMIADHTPNNAALVHIAQMKGYKLPDGIGSANEAIVDKLTGLSGAAFNSAYLKAQANYHTAAATLMRGEIASGSDASLLNFARKTLPVVNTHIALNGRSMSTMMHGGMMNGSGSMSHGSMGSGSMSHGSMGSGSMSHGSMGGKMMNSPAPMMSGGSMGGKMMNTPAPAMSGGSMNTPAPAMSGGSMGGAMGTPAGNAPSYAPNPGQNATAGPTSRP